MMRGLDSGKNLQLRLDWKNLSLLQLTATSSVPERRKEKGRFLCEFGAGPQPWCGRLEHKTRGDFEWTKLILPQPRCQSNPKSAKVRQNYSAGRPDQCKP